MKISIWKTGTILLASALLPMSATAQLDETCTVSALNRTALVDGEGVWVLPTPVTAEEEEVLATDGEPMTSCLETDAGPDFLDQQIRGAFEGVTVVQVIDRLNSDYRLPISFVEGPAGSAVQVSADGESVRTFLEHLLAQAPGYRCSCIEEHLIVFFDKQALHETVTDVSIVGQARATAARSYIEVLSRQVTAYRELVLFIGGPLEANAFSDEVSLDPEATVLRHLSQLLGADPKVFYAVRIASVGIPYLTIGSVP